MEDLILRADNVSYAYEDSEGMAVRGVTLGFRAGEMTAVLGHNGSGKSTLAKLLNGLYIPTEGHVTVCGIDTQEDEHTWDIRRSAGMVFQNPDNQLIASIVEEDVAFGPENLGLDPPVIRSRVDEALKAVGMYEFRTASPHHLSGGQKQRVAIAGIIAMQPECIVLDEPTAMLDPQGRAEIIDTVVRLNREKNITIVLITHFMEEAELADRILVMNDGKIVADAPPKTVFSDVALLKSVGLDVPQTTELLYRLRLNGADIETNVISIEETAQAIARAFHLEEA